MSTAGSAGVPWTPVCNVNHTKQCVISFSVLQLDCALVLFFRYLIGLAGSKIWLSVLKEKDEHHCPFDSDTKHSPLCLSALFG